MRRFRAVVCLILILMLLSCLFIILYHWQSFNMDSPSEIDSKLAGFITNELSRLLRPDIPAVEDVGEMVMNTWFKREKEFCRKVFDGTHRLFQNEACRKGCLTRDKPESRRNVIIIPYRNRSEHLMELIPRLAELLTKQDICYLLVVAEQADQQPFNKGIIMNAGFVEALNWIPFHCAIFHDVDLLPLNNEIPYTCSIYPRHISLCVDKFQNRLPYIELIGGVLSIPLKIFLRVNGYSNLFWGWGAEDDDMYERLMINGVPVTRPDPDVAQFTMLKHNPSPAFHVTLRTQILSFTKVRYRLDGINSLNYTLIDSNIKMFTTSKRTNENRNKSIDRRMHQVLHLKISVGEPPIHFIKTKPT
uniref:Beta-1,4-galactosyltransferase n=1 Tax=Trichobilharzia regenti TaxID=157069 RepID=A0AA85JKN4_TRIRE|nr:unnamed protein product [Trichobilharzia regenti]